MHRLLAFFLILLITLDSGCGSRPAPAQPPPKWELGFWLWNGSSARAPLSSIPLDLLYFQGGTIDHTPFYGVRQPWSIYARLPEDLPPARAYWLVFRSNQPAIPAIASISKLVAEVAEVQADARQRKINLTGIQLDIDVPTAALQDYAKYLQALRTALPKELQLSVTALLDWFRAGTWIGNVIEAVDEFVPQFYDVQGRDTVRGSSMIAAPIDAAKWGPKFNFFKKRYRIGVSTFGRSRLLPDGKASYVDLKPLDIGINRDFLLETGISASKEHILRYRATRKTSISYTDFKPGEGVEFILSTPDTIAAAVEQSRRMGNYCAGVLFFRWPTFNESMVMEPEVVMAVATGKPIPPKVATLRTIDERCALVHCSELYLEATPGLDPKPIRYIIEGSEELEYFIPDEQTPARMAGRGRLEFTLPPFGGRTRIRLGWAVAASPAKYILKELP